MENLIAGGLILLLGLLIGATIASLAYRRKQEPETHVYGPVNPKIGEWTTPNEMRKARIVPNLSYPPAKPNPFEAAAASPPFDELWVPRSFHDTQIARREGQVEALEKDLQRKKAQVRNQAEMIARREKAIDMQESRIEELRQGQSDQAQIISDLRREIKELREQRNNWGRESVRNVMPGQEASMDELIREFRRAKQNLQIVINQRDEVTAALNAAERERIDARNDLEICQRGNRELDDRIFELRKEVEELQRELDHVDCPWEIKLRDTLEENGRLTKNIETLSEDVRAVSGARDRLRETLRQVQQKLRLAERELSERPKVLDEMTLMHNGGIYYKSCRADVNYMTREDLAKHGLDGNYANTTCVLSEGHKSKHRDYYGKKAKNASE